MKLKKKCIHLTLHYYFEIILGYFKQILQRFEENRRRWRQKTSIAKLPRSRRRKSRQDSKAATRSETESVERHWDPATRQCSPQAPTPQRRRQQNDESSNRIRDQIRGDMTTLRSPQAPTLRRLRSRNAEIAMPTSAGDGGEGDDHRRGRRERE